MSTKTGLQYYKSHEEKKQSFNLIVINTDSQFDHLFRDLLPEKFNKGGIWRGITESKYKLYNTFQRENLESESPISDVVGFVKGLNKQFQVWDKKYVVQEFFQNFGIYSVPLFAKLSILRHYGIPSPLLDWSKNPNVAFYFATDICNYSTKKDLDNYFSLYFFDKEHPYYQFNSKQGVELFESNQIKNIIKRYKLYKSLFPSKRKLNSIFNNYKNIYDSINDFPIQRISDEEGDIINHCTMSNLNIVAQSGLFILNAHPTLPLEDAIIERIKQLSINDSLIREAKEKHRKNFVCFDIHKKFIPKIKKVLDSESVNIREVNIFPDFNLIKNDLSFDFIAESCKLRR